MMCLHEQLLKEFGRRDLAQITVPKIITDNLKQSIRPYQTEAFQRFLLFNKNSFVGRPSKPYHLLYNMATGSGKTLVMAGLILYLYHRLGYRHFLFFVNSKNIIKKTRDNFLNERATKYLFKEKIVMDDRQIFIKEVDNFDEADGDNINIKFTTIHQLHKDLQVTKENSLTLADFETKKTVLIADEAHHLQAATKQMDWDRPSWENTVIKILNTSLDNILLEFTATLDYQNEEIVTYYQDKVIQKYDLKQFRLEKYSKEINLLRSEYDEHDRILQALILNLYRQELAAANNINLKPVILFKAKRTIAESEASKENFHVLIEKLSPDKIDKIRKTSTILIVQKAFRFFDTKDLSSEKIVTRLKTHFKKENCISANDESEAEANQLRLNTLEDQDNPICALFAVHKLNEGWDVLNLFDIVRLYEGRDSRRNKPGKTTLAEAQLIGRGARYFPFVLTSEQDEYKRKYDDDPANDLKILETLYYHTKEDNRYISELKNALIDSGIYEDEDQLETKQLKLKPTFKKTGFYHKGLVFFNQKIEKNYNHVTSFADLGVVRRNITVRLSSGQGQVFSAFNVEPEQTHSSPQKYYCLALAYIPIHIIRYALSQLPFFYFARLVRYFPNLPSLSHFIKSNDYLGGLKITFSGTKDRLSNITNRDYLIGVNKLLVEVEQEIKANLVEYEGTDYRHEKIARVFKDKEIRVQRNTVRADGQEGIVGDADWYPYNANYGTDEEKKFVEMFAIYFVERLQKDFDNIYLIRNERVLKIYDKRGRAFEPDFLLFCQIKNGNDLSYQVFIEPKGKHLLGGEQEKWKEDFLKQMRDKQKTIKINSDNYLITAVPFFYNQEDEYRFRQALEGVLTEELP